MKTTSIILFLITACLFSYGCKGKEDKNDIKTISDTVSIATHDSTVQVIPKKDIKLEATENQVTTQNQKTESASTISIEEARRLVVGRYTPRNLGYSMEDMYKKTDYIDLNSNGTFTSYMELGDRDIGRGENYISGTYKVKYVEGKKINLEVTYIESEVYTRTKTWSVKDKTLTWFIGSGGVYQRD
ncbi:MAG TPA: hypothetical protein P5523_06765 [Bacteroidales bacterium]|jgi:hypothetical protein|nr:hypothetical protein [Prolixibacteraceae bacterium]HRT84324.1 hypothetical protein [Bacteroidales bacterium]